MVTMAEGAIRTDRFWQRMALGLAVLIVFGFLQFALRGLVDPMSAPFWVHLHGVAMLGWLGLLVIQPTLVARGNLALHRQLGWYGAALATLIVALGLYTGVASLVLHRFPAFFTGPYFLALVAVEPIVFGLLVMAAIRQRQATDWHRRLMIGATIIILEPALGRILPMPLMIGWSDIPIGLVQLAFVGIIALHDQRTLGHVHRATWTIAGFVVAVRMIVYLLSLTSPVEALATWLMGS